jgi:hypothetical protein
MVEISGYNTFARESSEKAIERLRGRVNTERGLVQKIAAETEIIDKYIQELTQHKTSQDLSQRALLIAISNMMEQARLILSSEATRAIEQTQEFDYPPLRNGLLRAIDDENTYEYSLGRGETATVKINLDRTAGRLQEYANAVQKARVTLLSGRPKWRRFFAEPAMASHFWKEKVYRPFREGVGEEKYADRYPETIALRVGYFTSPAPWWQLLDRGNVSGGLSSDRGGTPYPSFGPTGFVSKAERRIRRIIRGEFDTAKIELQNKVQKIIDKLYRKKVKMLEYVGSLSGALQNDTFLAKVTAAETLIKGKVAGYEYDPVKLKALAGKIATGEITTGRYRIGGGARISVRNLVRQIRNLYE